MKAISPIRSVRSCHEAVCCLADQSLSISRGKNPVEDPLTLLYDMNDCYCKLMELVPSIPQNRKVSKMEILQHVIDYIFDLQIALESQQQDPENSNASGSSILTLQRPELSSDGESLSLCHWLKRCAFNSPLQHRSESVLPANQDPTPTLPVSTPKQWIEHFSHFKDKFFFQKKRASAYLGSTFHLAPRALIF